MPSSDYIAHLDGVTVIPGGWLNQNWKQLGIQLADSFAGGGYSFTGSLCILYILHFLSKWIPALTLRATPEEEDMGMDDVEIGEYAVSFPLNDMYDFSDMICVNSTIMWRLPEI